MKTDAEVIRQYLTALRNIKMLRRSADRAVYVCFGSYDEHNLACKKHALSPDYILCQICKAQVQRSSADWLKDFVEALG